jgi:tRNA(adenine34) deaminase
MPEVAATAADKGMMERCVALSRMAADHGEFPFACVICSGDEVVAESVNRVARDQDITRHAEMVAISAAQRALGTIRLRNCSVYTNVEPCAMCSWAIREAGIGRVVFAIESPVMGGLTRWKLLDDQRLSKTMPFFFRRAPDLVGGLLVPEAEKVWSDWHPLLWRIIKRRGCLGSPYPPIAVIPNPGEP